MLTSRAGLSGRLAERVADGYAAKFDRQNDQAGNPPLGFRRTAEPRNERSNG